MIKKPDPRQPVDEAQRTQAYDDAMVDNRDFLIRALESAIHRGGLWYEYKAELLAFFVGVASSALVGFITGWLKGLNGKQRLTIRLVFGSPATGAGRHFGAVPSVLCPSIVLTFQA